MARDCDVVIVGGGPAGSSCAWRLAQAGLDVVVLDKKRFPRDKVCAGWITPAVLELLRLDPEDYRRGGNVFQPISSFRTSMLGAMEVTTDYSSIVSYGIRRREFDDYLLRRSGASLALGEALTSLVRKRDHWEINEGLRAPLVIGAGGHFCPVARHLGAKLGATESVVAAQEIEFPMSPEQAAACAVQARTPELFFCRDLSGYGWCFRKGNFLNIGLGREDSHRISEQVAAFVEFLKQRGRIPTDVPHGFLGHAYLLYRQSRPRRLVDDGVLLIGDAAGLAYPQSGEGIRPAVESGLIAAETVLAAAKDYRAERLEPYQADLTRRYGERSKGRAAPIWLPTALRSALAARLLANRWFSRNVVLDRWFLHRDQPPLPRRRLA